MRTKIVYVVTSSVEDIYWEYTWLSVWSLKQHNPSACAVIICDDDTLDSAKKSYRANSLELFDEIVPVRFGSDISNKVRSRWLKTNLRNLIQGDFLYVDSDTIITDSLSEIDDFDFDIGMVYSMHTYPNPLPQVFKWYKEAFNEELPPDAHYYNGGVIYAKDSESAKLLFNSWHKNWKLAGNKVGYSDQPALAKAILEQGNPVHELPGIYNCLACVGIRYLQKAKIMHFLHKPYFIPTVVHPFMQEETYQKIKKCKDIPEEIKKLALNCKSEFTTVSAPLGINEANFLRSTVIHDFLYPIYNKKRSLFNHIDKMTSLLLSWLKRPNNIFHKYKLRVRNR